YCSGGVGSACVPVAPASINIIGEDGYWTLPDVSETVEVEALDASPSTNRADALPAPAAPNVAALPGLPLRFGIGALLVLAIVGIHLWVMPAIRRALDSRAADQSLLEVPFVRVLVPPRTFTRAATFHRVSVTMCFCLLALAAAWVVAVTLPFFFPENLVLPGTLPSAIIALAQALTRAVIPLAVLASFLIVVYMGVGC